MTATLRVIEGDGLGSVEHQRYGLRSYDGNVIPRKAAKPYRCYLARYAERAERVGDAVPSNLIPAEGCPDAIAVGAVYIEDRSGCTYGESGMRLCVACARKRWGKYIEVSS